MVRLVILTSKIACATMSSRPWQTLNGSKRKMNCVEHSYETLRRRWGVKPARIAPAERNRKYPQVIRPLLSNSTLRGLVKRVISHVLLVKNRSARVHHCRVDKSTTNNASSDSSDGGPSDPDSIWFNLLHPIVPSLLIHLVAIFACTSYFEVAK